MAKNWNDTADEMYNDIVNRPDGTTKQDAYATCAEKLSRTASAVENKFRKMCRAENGDLEMKNEMKNRGRKGVLSLVRYYAKDANGLDTLLGTGTSNTVLAVIQAIQNDSGVAQ